MYKSKPHVVYFLLLISVLFTVYTPLLSAQLPVDSVLTILNTELDNREFHYQKKEEQLKQIKIELDQAEDLMLCFDLNNELYNEYIYYQYDSAYTYVKKSLEVACKLQEETLITTSQINLMNCYISCGFYKEAYKLSNSISAEKLPDADRLKYYKTCHGLYEHLYHYTRGSDLEQSYKQKALEYADSSLLYLKPGTFDYEFNKAFIYAGTTNDKQTILQKFEKLLQTIPMSQHNYAIVYSVLGRDYYDIDSEKAIFYSALSCINDIRAAIRETTSKKIVGSLLYRQGDVLFASKCIQVALEDANFYNSRQRQIEVNSILPIIEKERLNQVEKQKSSLTTLLWIVCSLIFTLLISIIIIIKQNRNLSHARKSIQQQLTQISNINEKLVDSYQVMEKTNIYLKQCKKDLEESNRIKDMYIVQSLYSKSEYIDLFENLLKKIDRKLNTRQYEDLRNLHKEINIKAERETTFSSFDQTFLLLFPNFINEYNQFFLPEDQVVLDKDKNLTPELRIFALIRLGVTENEKIAKFLNLSVKTVYSYKGKVKSKAIIPKEEFEYRIINL